MAWTDSTESKSLRLRLVALLSLYDLLPPTFDKAAFLDFNSPPPLDATAIDRETTLHSLLAIAQQLQSRGLDRDLSTATLSGEQQISCSNLGEHLPPRRLDGSSGLLHFHIHPLEVCSHSNTAKTLK